MRILFSFVLLFFTGRQLYAQDNAILKGLVQNQNNEPLGGVSVSAVNLSTGRTLHTTSDEKGIFKLSYLPQKGIYDLTFSYVGYESSQVNNFILKEVENSLLIRLHQGNSNLNDLVVVGYGTKNRYEITGAISKIDSKEFADRPVTQASQIFYGIVPGVFVNANTSEAGNGQASFNIRGIGTLNDARALILVDGIEAPMENVNPTDIASITVLKDAAAAAIYGSRAANGVVLITTRKAKLNAPARVSYNGYAGASSPTVLPKMVTDNATYLTLYREAAINSNTAYSFTDADIARYSKLPSTNWFDVIFNKQALIHDHTVSLSMGNEKLASYISLGYLDQDGILKDQSFQRYNTRINVDAKVSDRIKTGALLSYSYGLANLASKGDPDAGSGITDVNSLQSKGSLAFEAALSQHPIVPVYDSLGQYATLEQKLGIQRSRNNGQAVLDNETLQQKNNTFLGSIFAEYEPLKQLKVRGTLAINYQDTGYVDTRKQFSNYDIVTAKLVSINDPGSQLIDQQITTQKVTAVLQASYEKKIKDHTLSALVGYNQESAALKTNTAEQTGFASTSLVTLGNGATTLAAFTSQGQYALRSLFGRIGYDYDGRYLAEVNVRRDGSSRFGPNNRYGTFPSFSAGWILSNEKFWNKNPVDFLKLRASWGRLGNQNTALYPFASQISLSSGYSINNTYTSGGAISVLGNPDLKWETTTTTDLGMDINLFQSALTFEADYFVRKASDILTPINNPLTLGVVAPTIVNAASVQNKGWEVSANYNFRAGPLNIGVGGNMTYVNNKVTTINPSLSPDADKVELNSASSIWLIRGQPVNAIYGYKVTGIFQTADEIAKAPNHKLFGIAQPGDFRFQDTDGDGAITSKDRVVIGNRQPKWLYGFNLKVRMKNFDLLTLFQGVGRFDTYQSRQVGPFAFAGIRQYWLNRWTPGNPSKTMPRLWIDRSGYEGATIETLPSSFWVQNLAYLRLKNIQLGYTLTKQRLARFPFTSMRIYINAQNLFTFTKYKDFDPERLSTQQFVTNSLPQLRIITGGLNINF